MSPSRPRRGLEVVRAAIAAFAVFAAFACGSDKADDAKRNAKLRTRDWSTAPLKRVKTVVKDVAFSIELPDGLHRDSGSISTNWSVEGTAHLVSPVIHVAVSETRLPSDVDAAASQYMMSTATIESKKAIPGGYLVVFHDRNKARVSARVYLRVTERRTLYCEASQSRGGGVPNADAVMDWLARICSSLKLEQ